MANFRPLVKTPYIPLFAAAALVLLAQLLGLLWSEQWWGTHFAAFMGLGAKALLALAAVLLGVAFWQRNKALSWKPAPGWMGVASALLGATLVALACYYWPIAADYYGNARTFIPDLQNVETALEPGFFDPLLSLTFKPGQGRHAAMVLVKWWSYAAGVTHAEAFVATNAIGAFVFALLWMLGVRWLVTAPHWRTLLSVVGLVNPVFLVVAGHMETYAIVMVLLVAWLLLLLHQLRSRSALLLWLLVPLLLLGVRFHAFFVLLGPAWAVAVAQQYFRGAWQQRFTTVKGVARWMGLPIVLGGLIAYFFILGDYNDPRSLDGDFRDIERLFLPLLSPEPPLDRYNLLSFNHLFDLGNMMLMLLPVVTVMLLGLVGWYRKALQWKPATVALLAALLTMSAMVFAFNPLMSMPMDWDVFTIPGVVALVLLLALVREVEHEALPRPLLWVSGALLPLSVLPFAVLSDVEQHSQRVEAVGMHVYKTYYAHSGTYLLYALNMIEGEPERYDERKQRILRELQPYALPGNDPKYAGSTVLLHELGAG